MYEWHTKKCVTFFVTDCGLRSHNKRKRGLIMFQKLKRKFKPTTIFLIVGFAISMMSVLLGISMVSSILISLAETDSDAPILLTMQIMGVFFVCVIAMQTILSSVTNAASMTYQKNIFESSIDIDMGKVLHLDYHYMEERPEFAKVIRQYLDYIRNIPDVKAVGQFDATGMYFSELETMEEYKTVNGKLLEGQKYEDYPAITQLLSVDEKMLSLVKGGITKYIDTKSGLLPLYASNVYQDILPIGTILTDKRTGDKYEIAQMMQSISKPSFPHIPCSMVLKRQPCRYLKNMRCTD